MFENAKNSNSQGNIGMCYAMAYYAKLGWVISIPITDCQDYDLVVDNGEKLLKIQVKTTNFLDKSIYQVNLRTTSGNKTSVKRKDFSENSSDILFILTGDKTMYSIPKENIESKTTINLGEKYKNYIVTL